jgi:hypothetical protein
MNSSSDLKIFENSQPSASNFKSFSQSLEQFFLTAGQNNFNTISNDMRLHKYIDLTVQNIILLRLDAVEVGLILKHDKFTI